MNTRFFMLFAVAVTLAACSGGPSTSDAKDAVIQQLGGGCDRIKIKDFDKVNGVAVGDSAYQLSVTYSLEIEPPSGDDLTQEQYETKMKDLTQKTQQAQQATADAQKARGEFLTAHNTTESTLTYEEPNTPVAQQYAVLAKAEGDAETQASDAQQQSLQLQLEPAKTFWAECHGIRSDVGNLIVHDADPYYNKEAPDTSAYLTGFTVDVKETLNMIKTDNGWKESL